MSNPWLQILAVLLLYGVLFYVWYAVKTRRGLGLWLQKSASKAEIRIVETQGIGPRTSATLIEVRSQPLLVIQSPHGIQVVPLGREAAPPAGEKSS